VKGRTFADFPVACSALRLSSHGTHQQPITSVSISRFEEYGLRHCSVALVVHKGVV